MNPVWNSVFSFLEVDDVKAIHMVQVEKYGGKDGIRERGLLESAVSMPQASFDGEWLHKDVYDQAAAYWFHLIKNHPFFDGNKRVGVATALVFLEAYGIGTDYNEDEMYDLVMDTIAGTKSKDDVAAFLRKRQ